MPAKIHPVIRRRARELWEDEGYSPGEILEALSFELAGGTLLVHADIAKVVLPQDRSVLHKWAKAESWQPWRNAKKKVNQKIDENIAEGVPFPISGIVDPIWHLSVVETQAYIGDMRDSMPTIWEVLRHVNNKLQPGPKVLERLRPVIRSEIKRAMETHRWFHSFDPDKDKSVPPVKRAPTDYMGEPDQIHS